MTENCTFVCIYCGGIYRKYLSNSYFADILRCEKCGLIAADPNFFLKESDFNFNRLSKKDSGKDEYIRTFITGIDPSDERGTLYTRGYNQEEVSQALYNQFKTVLEQFAPEIDNAPWNYLEIGSATGFLANEVNIGFSNSSVHCVEPSPFSCQKCKKLYGIEPHVGTMNTFNIDEKKDFFHAVVCIGNLQLHEDFIRTLEQCYTVMRRGSIILLDMKNPNASIRRIVSFVSRNNIARKALNMDFFVNKSFDCIRYAPDKKLLKNIIKKIGFEVLLTSTVPPRSLLFSNNRKVAKGFTGLLWRAFDYLDLILDERAWIQIVARKP